MPESLSLFSTHQWLIILITLLWFLLPFLAFFLHFLLQFLLLNFVSSDMWNSQRHNMWDLQYLCIDSYKMVKQVQYLLAEINCWTFSGEQIWCIHNLLSEIQPQITINSDKMSNLHVFVSIFCMITVVFKTFNITHLLWRFVQPSDLQGRNARTFVLVTEIEFLKLNKAIIKPVIFRCACF